MTKLIRRRSALKILGTTLSAPFILGLSGCGTLLYPERRNQQGTRFDATVILLDGLGLFFYIIPGLIAYAIDFATGAIYLPKGQVKGAIIRADPEHLIPEQIRSVIFEETGIEIDLNDPRLVVKKLHSLDEMEVNFALYETESTSNSRTL
ncbi:MAG: polyribonucleotide nucleotidyltransferase [Deltaproteobacteria bacterium]|nr:polyribonucleotide nucleotidyltransferase [Deltaproteobacteria bacterium]